VTTWRDLVVGDLVAAGTAEVRTGPFGTQLRAADYTPDGVPVLNVRNLGYGTIRRASVERVDEEVQHRLAGHLLAEGDIVFGRKGAVDRHALIGAGEEGWMQGSDCIRLRLLPGAPITAAFLSKALLTPSHRRWMEAQCSHGATMASLNQDIVSRISVSVPDLAMQSRVGAVLGAFDELIEINERRIELLEDLARSLYREWFVRFRFPRNEETALVDSPLGTIPSGWDVVPLNKLLTTQYGFTAAATGEPGGPRFLRGMDINKRSFIDWSTVPFVRTSEEEFVKFRLEVGDVCVVRMADPGKVGIVERPVDAIFASYLVRLRSEESRLPPMLLFHYLDSTEYQAWIRGSSTGATRKSASAAVLTEPCIALPPLDVAARFSEHATAFRTELATLVEANAALAAARDLLLPRLVTGRLDISDVDLGELLPTERE
jgi:type I restriction enzyme S subunit